MSIPEMDQINLCGQVYSAKELDVVKVNNDEPIVRIFLDIAKARQKDREDDVKLSIKQNSEGGIEVDLQETPKGKPGWGQWARQVGSGLKHAVTGNTDPRSIHNISKAMEEIARNMLSSDPIKQIEGHENVLISDPKYRDKLLTSAKTHLNYLNNLKINLEHHNEVIKDYNKAFIAKDSMLACKGHQAVLSQIEEKHEKLEEFVVKLTELARDEQLKTDVSGTIKELKPQIDSIKADKLQQAKTLAQQISDDIKDGKQRVDDNFISTSYAQLVKAVQDLDPSQRAELVAQFPVMSNPETINIKYIETLKKDMESGKTPDCIKFIKMILNSYSKLPLDQAEAKYQKAGVSMLDKLLKDLDLVGQVTLTQLSEIIKNRYPETLISQCSDIKPQDLPRVELVLNKLYDLETQWNLEVFKAQQQSVKDVQDFAAIDKPYVLPRKQDAGLHHLVKDKTSLYDDLSGNLAHSLSLDEAGDKKDQEGVILEQYDDGSAKIVFNRGLSQIISPEESQVISPEESQENSNSNAIPGRISREQADIRTVSAEDRALILELCKDFKPQVNFQDRLDHIFNNSFFQESVLGEKRLQEIGGSFNTRALSSSQEKFDAFMEDFESLVVHEALELHEVATTQVYNQLVAHISIQGRRPIAEKVLQNMLKVGAEKTQAITDRKTSEPQDSKHEPRERKSEDTKRDF